jgi:hypothetical protein
MSDRTPDLFAAVLASGSDADLSAWAATGPSGVVLLRDELAGRRTTTPARQTSPRDIIDNLSAATVAIAESEPEVFLDAFAGVEWASNTFVLDGFGRIDGERATDRLIEATRSGDEWARMHAAIGLAGRRSDAVSIALERLLDATEYLVRYHALASLSTSGTPAAVAHLERFDPPSDIERAMRDEAIRRIADATSGPAATV